MSETRSGKCNGCLIVWQWDAKKCTLRVTKDQAYCRNCGRLLVRTAASLVRGMPKKDGTPISYWPALRKRQELAKEKEARKGTA